MTVSRFHIQRMDCAAEEQLVRMALSEVSGVQRIEVDLDRRDVLVAHEGDASQIDHVLAALDLGSSQVAEAGSFSDPADPRKERGALIFAFIVNVGFFVGELAFGLLSNSMGLIADALDMGADATVYALSLAAVGAAAAHKKRYARLSGYLQFGLALLGVAEVLRRFVGGEQPPDPTTMVVLSVLALAGTIAVLVDLHCQRHQGESTRDRGRDRGGDHWFGDPGSAGWRHHLRRRGQRGSADSAHEPLKWTVTAEVRIRQLCAMRGGGRTDPICEQVRAAVVQRHGSDRRQKACQHTRRALRRRRARPHVRAA
jgi:Co/Zn/Cd efflux system component